MSSPPRTLCFCEAAFPGEPAFDTGVSRALLRRVAEGGLGASLRIHRTADVVAFSPLDAVRPGFREAVAAARAAGFAAVRRLAGGRAAVFHRETLAFAWCVPAADPRLDVEARFAAISGITARALRSLGIDARVGEVPGEYCPGAWSVNARGRRKLMGVGQRLVRGAAHVGGVLVVRRSDRVRDALLPVYDALGVVWDPESAGSVEDELAAVSCEDVTAALLVEFRRHHELVELDLDPATLALARHFAPEHEIQL